MNRNEEKRQKVIEHISKKYGVYITTYITKDIKYKLRIHYTEYFDVAMGRKKVIYCPFVVDGIPILD